MYDWSFFQNMSCKTAYMMFVIVEGHTRDFKVLHWLSSVNWDKSGKYNHLNGFLISVRILGTQSSRGKLLAINTREQDYH